jgi:hypothetical protein
VFLTIYFNFLEEKDFAENCISPFPYQASATPLVVENDMVFLRVLERDLKVEGYFAQF